MAHDSFSESSASGWRGRAQWLDELVVDYIDRLNAGERLGREEIIAEHPELGEQILAELEAFVNLQDVAVDAPPLGTLGDYTLRRRIGRGGMGVVYEAWQGSMDRVVALKVLPPGVAADDQSFNRFMREAKTAGKLDHRNIVSVYAAGFDENTPYYAMEYVEGETLSQVVGRLREVDPDVETAFGKKDQVGYFAHVASAFADVADGLQHAHSKGVIHRDIKPSNLIVDSEGRLRILDFGLARLEGQESLTLTGDFLGTPAYMSPEQARRRKIPVDHRTDIYSLGATLYELLTHEQPFHGKDHADTLSRIIERDPRPPRWLNARVPPDLETIVLKCLRKDAGDRYGTAEALEQDLGRFVRGDPIEARPEDKWERLARQLKRNAKRIALTSLFLLLTLSVLLLGFLRYQDSLYQQAIDSRYEIESAVLKAQLVGLALSDEGLASMKSDIAKRFISVRDFPRSWANVEESVEELQRLSQKYPERPGAHFHRARALAFLDREEEARSALEQALLQKPDFVPALVLQEVLCGVERAPEAESKFTRVDDWSNAWRAAYQAMKNGDWKAAEASFGELIRLERDGAELYLGAFIETRIGRGIARLNQRSPRAIEDFDAVRFRFPDVAEPALFQGKAYYVVGHKEEAEEVFVETYCGPMDVAEKDEICLRVVEIYRQLEDFSRCQEWVERIQNKPLRERLRAMALFFQGDVEGALAAAEEAVALEPDALPGYEVKGFVLRRHWKLKRTEESFEDAEAFLSDAIARFPHSTLLRCHLAWVRFRLDEYESAAELSRQVVAMDDKVSEAHHVLGVSLFVLGDSTQGIESLEEARRLDPEIADHWGNLGWAYILLGDLDAALLMLDKALSISPKSEWIRHFRSIAHERLGNFAEAIEDCQEACRGYPPTYWGHYLLGLLHVRTGDLEAALREYGTALEMRPGRVHHHYRLCQLLRGAPKALLAEESVRLADRLTERIESGEDHPHLLHALALLSIHEEEVNSRARGLVESALERTKRPNPELLATQAKLESRDGDVAEAVRLLEEAIDLQRATKLHVALLDEYRARLTTAIPSYRSVDAILTSRLRRFGRLAGVARLAGGGPNVQAYLEGRLLQLGGVHDRAADRFEALVAVDSTRFEPARRLAESLVELGREKQSEVVLRAALADHPNSTALWQSWLSVAPEDPADALRNFPGPDGNDRTPVPGGRSRDLRQDVRWVLESLRDGQGLRVNCGGRDYKGTDGRAWSRDRFYTGGYTHTSFVVERFYGSTWASHPMSEDSLGFPFRGDVSGTQDDYLFQTARWFPREAIRPGYQIPLPEGVYSVTLHFAETWYKAPGLRRFDVVIEEEPRLEGFEPFSSGFANAVTRTFRNMSVTDGLLDIEFVADLEYPQVCAIEVTKG